MTKFIVKGFKFFYGVSRYDVNCNLLNPYKDIHTYVHESKQDPRTGCGAFVTRGSTMVSVTIKHI